MDSVAYTYIRTGKVCVAGEVTMPYYLTKSRDKDADFQKHGWTEVARELRDQLYWALHALDDQLVDTIELASEKLGQRVERGF